jgi:hypothetical protein
VFIYGDSEPEQIGAESRGVLLKNAKSSGCGSKKYPGRLGPSLESSDDRYTPTWAPMSTKERVTQSYGRYLAESLRRVTEEIDPAGMNRNPHRRAVDAEVGR